MVVRKDGRVSHSSVQAEPDRYPLVGGLVPAAQQRRRVPCERHRKFGVHRVDLVVEPTTPGAPLLRMRVEPCPLYD